MAKGAKFEATGIVEDSHPGAKFTVRLGNDREVLAYASGKIRQNGIDIMPGDEVTVEISGYDLTRGRITFRHD